MPETAKDQIRQFVTDIAQRKGLDVVTDDESLTSNGVIDSLGIFKLVSFLEDTFRLKVADDEITNENFESINEIDRFVVTRLEKRPA